MDKSSCDSCYDSPALENHKQQFWCPVKSPCEFNNKIDPFTVPSAIYWNSDPANMIARLGLSSREIQTAVLVAFRWKEILLLFKMVLKYRDKAISSLEDIQNLTAKDLREIL